MHASHVRQLYFHNRRDKTLSVCVKGMSMCVIDYFQGLISCHYLAKSVYQISRLSASGQMHKVPGNKEGVKKSTCAIIKGLPCLAFDFSLYQKRNSAFFVSQCCGFCCGFSEAKALKQGKILRTSHFSTKLRRIFGATDPIRTDDLLITSVNNFRIISR